MLNEEYRLINAILSRRDINTVDKLKINRTFFRIEECRVAFDYIKEYNTAPNTLGYLPSVEVFKKRYPAFPIIDDDEIEPIPVLCEELRIPYMESQIDKVIIELTALKHKPYDAITTLQDSSILLTSQHTATHDVFNFADCGDLLIEEYEKAEKSKGLLGIPWPWPTMNEATYGIQKKNWVVVYGRPKTGKTTILIGMAAYIYKHFNKRIILFNFEDTEVDLLKLFACFSINADYGLAYGGKLNPADKQRYYTFCKSLKEAEVPDDKGYKKAFIVEQCMGANVAYLKSKIEEYKADIAIINGAYLLKDGSRKTMDMDWKVITNISRSVKQLAREMDIPIFGICQENQDGKVAYADAFNQDADLVVNIESALLENKQRAAKLQIKYIRTGIPCTFYINSKPGLEISEREGVTIEAPQENNKKKGPPPIFAVRGG